MSETFPALSLTGKGPVFLYVEDELRYIICIEQYPFITTFSLWIIEVNIEVIDVLLHESLKDE